MAINRACEAAGVPHFVRHKAGLSWAEIGDIAGQRSRIVTANT